MSIVGDRSKLARAATRASIGKRTRGPNAPLGIIVSVADYERMTATTSAVSIERAQAKLEVLEELRGMVGARRRPNASLSALLDVLIADAEGSMQEALEE